MNVIISGFEVGIYDKAIEASSILESQIDEFNEDLLDILLNKYEKLDKNSVIHPIIAIETPIYSFVVSNNNEIDIGSKYEEYFTDYRYIGLFLTNSYYVKIVKSLNDTFLYSRFFYNITTRITGTDNEGCSVEIVVDEFDYQLSGFILSESMRLYDSVISQCHLSSYFYSCLYLFIN